MNYIIKLPESHVPQLQQWLRETGFPQEPIPGIISETGLWSNLDQVKLWYEENAETRHTVWENLPEETRELIADELADYVTWQFPDYGPVPSMRDVLDNFPPLERLLFGDKNFGNH